MHVSDDARNLARALSTAATLVGALTDLRLRIVVNGAALQGLVGTEAPRLPPGVGVDACAIGLENHGIDRSALAPGIDVVPSAAVALVQAQLAGAAYLRL